MSPARRSGPESYARAVERHWAQHRQTAVVLSPREWRFVSEWYLRGVPLQLVREAIDAAFEPRRGRARREPRSLAYVAAAVEESWRVLCDGRLARPPDPEPRSAWQRRCDDEPEGSSLRLLLERLLAASARGEVATAVDGALDRELVRAVGPDVRRDAEARVARRLALFPQGTEDLERVRERAVVAQLRLRLGLPRLG